MLFFFLDLLSMVWMPTFFWSDFIRLFFLQACFRCASSYGLTLVFPGLGNHTFAFKHASFGVTFRAFLISSVNQLMSQTMELWNSSTIFSCLGWIVRFCNKTKCFVFFNCLRKSNVLLCHKKIHSSFQRKDTGNIKYIENKCQSTWT